jgi:hypothetical protein
MLAGVSLATPRAPTSPPTRALASRRPSVGPLRRDPGRGRRLLSARTGSRPRRAHGSLLPDLLNGDAVPGKGALVRDLERDAVLLRALGNPPLGLELSYHGLERAPVRDRGEMRPIEPMGRAHELLRGARRRGRAVGSGAAPARPPAARRLRCGVPTRALRRGCRRPSTASPAPTSPPPRLAHLGPPIPLRNGPGGRRTTAAPGRSTPAPR